MGGAAVRGQSGVHQLCGGRRVCRREAERFGEVRRGHGCAGVGSCVALEGTALPRRAALGQDQVLKGRDKAQGGLSRGGGGHGPGQSGAGPACPRAALALKVGSSNVRGRGGRGGGGRAVRARRRVCRTARRSSGVRGGAREAGKAGLGCKYLRRRPRDVDVPEALGRLRSQLRRVRLQNHKRGQPCRGNAGGWARSVPSQRPAKVKHSAHARYSGAARSGEGPR